MKKIKIIYGLEAVGGGALKHLVYLVTRLSNESFEITVVLSKSRDDNSTLEISSILKTGIRVIFLSMCRNINLLNDMASFFKIVTILKKGKYDIVHAHSSKAGALFRLAALICKIPLVFYTPHCFYYQGKTGFRRLIFLYVEKILSVITSGIIVSENEKKEILRNKITKANKVININNAIDFADYQQSIGSDETLRDLSIPGGAFIVGAIGRLTPQKDWETFIYAANEVLKKYPETVFIITGEGELKQDIQKLIFKLGLDNKIILTGYIHRIHKIYAIIDVFVSTSLWEGLPYVFLEAMKYNKPIIATNTGDENAVAHEKSGFITPVKDYHSISDKIKLLIEDKQKAIKMGKEGNKILMHKYSFELFIKSHEELYKKSYVNNMCLI